MLRTSQGVCSEECEVEAGGGWGSLEKRLFNSKRSPGVEGHQASNLLPKLQFHPQNPWSPQIPLGCSPCSLQTP